MVSVEEHVLSVIKSTPITQDPFPHFFATNVFPEKTYEDLRAQLETRNDYINADGGRFANRTFADGSTLVGTEFMHSRDFLVHMLHIFDSQLKEKFGGTKSIFRRDMRLVRDHKNYAIGPHTDGPWKVLSLLFYLPPDGSLIDYGTSFYEPLDPTFRCPGGPHHRFEDFREVGRAPFLPNSCLGFWKTDRSFHGVAPIPVNITRDVLLYNIYHNEPQ